MAKEAWEEDIYNEGEKDLKRSKKSADVTANRLLTILAVIFCIIVIVLVALMIYLSVGGGNKQAATEGFYNAENVTQQSSESSSQVSASSEVAQEENTNEETQASSEGTVTVMAGEGAASIAARGGISISELERLNPSHMTTGSWYANPGDIVKIR